MSGFLGQMLGGQGLGALAGAVGGTAGVGGLLQQLIGGAEGAGAGGLPGLLAQFESAGLGTQVQSWLGSGENLPLTVEHVVAAIPPQQLAALASQVGLPGDQVASVLAQVLPHAIDHATPNGEVPAAPDFGRLLGGLFGR